MHIGAAPSRVPVLRATESAMWNPDSGRMKLTCDNVVGEIIMRAPQMIRQS